MTTTHEMQIEYYTEPCYHCRGHGRARLVCSCGHTVELADNYGGSIGYDLDFRFARLEHLLGIDR